jgi:hypothetical protein
MTKSVKFGDRTLVLSSLVVPSDPLPDEGYLVLLPAFSESENINSLEVARFYMSSLCKELCCVGANATKLEEEIDGILEDAGLFIPTTAVLDEDACDYFLFGADAGVARYLFAPVEGHPDLVATLIAMAQSFKKI